MRRVGRRRRVAGLLGLAGAAALAAGFGAARLRTPTVLQRATPLLRTRIGPSIRWEYGGRIANDAILLILDDDNNALAVRAAVLDTRTGVLRSCPGLTATLQRHAKTGEDLSVLASPDGEHVLWCGKNRAGLANLAGSLDRPIVLNGVSTTFGARDYLEPHWSPDGSRWMLAHHISGVDTSCVSEICEGLPDSGKPSLSGTGLVSGPPQLLEPDALTPDGRIVGTDARRGAFMVDPRTWHATAFYLDGLEKEAYGVEFRATAAGKLVWGCEVPHERSPIPLVAWLRERLRTEERPTSELHVNNMDGTEGRDIGRMDDDSLMLDGVSPDGRWVDFESGGKLYTTRIP